MHTKRCLVLLIVGSLPACATWSAHGVDVTAPRRLNVIVLPVASTATVKRLTDIETTPAPAAVLALSESERITARIATATLEATDTIETRLRASRYLSPMAAPTPAKPVIDREFLQACGRQGADAILRVNIEGYGKLRRKWVWYLLGSGVVEGAVQGALLAKATGSAAAGIGILIEEVLQEWLTWGGGAYIFNAHYTPVTLSGELLSAHDGKVLWHHTSFSATDRKALRALPAAERERKETQLRATLDKTIADFIGELEAEIQRQQDSVSNEKDTPLTETWQ